MRIKPIVSLQTSIPFSHVLQKVLEFHLFSVEFIEDDILNFNKSRKYVENNGNVDAIFFDPPYIFGRKKGNDVRSQDYGGYDYALEQVKDFITSANNNFPEFLKDKGLLFLKHTDVFSLEERKFYFCASIWPIILSNFKVIDHYIVPPHHISPTAWQVKNRPCGIVNYTYLTVFGKGGSHED